MQTFALCFVTLTALLMFPSWAMAQDASTTARPAKVYVATAEDVTLERSYPAIVFPSQEVELSFRVSGRLIELPIRASTRVEEGDVVARLDTRDFELSVTQLEAQRDQLEAQLQVLRSGARPEEIAALEAALQAAVAQLDQARDEFERTRQLVERGVVSTAQLEQSEAAFRVAEAQVVSRREELTIGQIGGRPEEIAAGEAQVRALDAQLQNARDNLSDATLRAPFDGIIARRHVENFANVQAGQEIALMQNLSTVEVGFDIPAADVVSFAAVGYENVMTTVTFDSIPGVELAAELVEFATQADAGTQTYRGRLLVKLDEGLIVLPGMVARVNAQAGRGDTGALVVPQSALAADTDGSAYVWRVDPATNTVHRQDVELGDVTDSGTVIQAGLESGQTIVSAGVGGLQEGMRIRPVDRIGG